MKKRTRHRIGLDAEALCRLILRLKGYGIVAARRRGQRFSPVGEVDIIARRGSVLAFVEVKARADQAEAAAAIHPQQQKRLAAAANDFLARNPQFHHHTLRFDAMLIAPGRWPVHMTDAWRP